MSQHPRASIAKMEHARFWMWAKRKEGLSSHLQAPININSYDDSWEEQAFAEDTAAGALGGCVWPPRSYTCTFCRREFRSAQALGGHMNVHRRDRARLKQSPTSQTEFLHQDAQNHNNHLPNPYSLGFQYPSQNNCTLVCTSPNPSSDPGSIVSPSSTSRVSTPTQENSTKKTSLFTPISSSIVEGEHNNGSTSTSLRPLCPNLGEEEKNSTISIDQSGCRAKVDYLKTDLSVSLNLVVRRTRPITISDNEEEEEVQPMACKRRRTESALPFFLRSNSNSVDRCSPCSIEELDLELRLGDRPKGQ